MNQLMATSSFKVDLDGGRSNRIRWAKWLRRFNLEAIGETGDRKKIAMLLHVGGESVEEIYEAKREVETRKENEKYEAGSVCPAKGKKCGVEGRFAVKCTKNRFYSYVKTKAKEKLHSVVHDERINVDKSEYELEKYIRNFIQPNSSNKFITNEPQNPSDQVKLVAELAGNNKSRKLDSNTKKFSGSNHEDVDDWLFNIVQGFITSKITEEDKLNAVLNFVDKGIKKHLYKVNKDHWVRSQLAILKHKESLPFENYVNRFYQLTNMLPRMADDEKLFHFKEGLRDYIKREVTCRNLHTLSETIHLATQLEQARDGYANINYLKHKKPDKFNNKFASNKINDKKTSYSSKASNCKKENNYKTQGNKAEHKSFDKHKQKPKTNPTAICNRCKRKGHYANNCYANLNKVNSLNVCNDSEEKNLCSLSR
ncbi:unnamed protein product [Brachionus calyciflorus]|uniref:CCHC-type domain-containing protein n=1 Tax=Brachionus calyciflorus TaxID=104777 RepID=A0A814DN86_9BILA|nr:unnamed protein product [Brachionus calyciflorus]